MQPIESQIDSVLSMSWPCQLPPQPPDLKYPRMCSKWDKCSVNCCPLDVYNPTRQSISGDPEQTCKESLGKRLAVIEIAKTDGVEIPGGGWTKAERETGMSLEAMLADWDRREAAKKASGHALRMAYDAKTHGAAPRQPDLDDTEVQPDTNSAENRR